MRVASPNKCFGKTASNAVERSNQADYKIKQLYAMASLATDYTISGKDLFAAIYEQIKPLPFDLLSGVLIGANPENVKKCF